MSEWVNSILSLGVLLLLLLLVAGKAKGRIEAQPCRRWKSQNGLTRIQGKKSVRSFCGERIPKFAQRRSVSHSGPFWLAYKRCSKQRVSSMTQLANEELKKKKTRPWTLLLLVLLSNVGPIRWWLVKDDGAENIDTLWWTHTHAYTQPCSRQTSPPSKVAGNDDE